MRSWKCHKDIYCRGEECQESGFYTPFLTLFYQDIYCRGEECQESGFYTPFLTLFYHQHFFKKRNQNAS